MNFDRTKRNELMRSDSIREAYLSECLKMMVWEPAFELAQSIKDRQSGFCTTERVQAARAKIKFVYTHLKHWGLKAEFLPVMRETVRKYRK